MPTDQRDREYERARRYAQWFLLLSDRWVEELIAGRCSDDRSAQYERILARMQAIITRGLLS